MIIQGGGVDNLDGVGGGGRCRGSRRYCRRCHGPCTALQARALAPPVSWIGIARLSPFMGGPLYAIMGVNRVKRRAQKTETSAPATRARAIRKPRWRRIRADAARIRYRATDEACRRSRAISSRCCIAATRPIRACSRRSAGLRRASGCAATFSAPIRPARRFHQALIQAERRGVKVRSADRRNRWRLFLVGHHQHLRKAGVPVARFLACRIFPGGTPFLNLRNHRKVLVIDGRVAFTGGLNIGEENVEAANPTHPVRDTHFRIEGPVVEQLTDAFADDWLFTTGEQLRRRGLVPAPRAGRNGSRRESCRRRPRRGHGADRVRGAARHLLRARIDPCGDTLLPAGRTAHHGAGAGGACAASRSISCCPRTPTTRSSTGRDGAAAAADRSGLPHLAAAGAVRSLQAHDDRRFLGRSSAVPTGIPAASG